MRLPWKFWNTVVHISIETLEEAGFKHRGGYCEEWAKHDIRVWDFNGEYWIVNALDQAGINKEFKTMGELARFFWGCGIDMYAEEAGVSDA